MKKILKIYEYHLVMTDCLNSIYTSKISKCVCVALWIVIGEISIRTVNLVRGKCNTLSKSILTKHDKDIGCISISSRLRITLED